jgi:hypothetical protein
MNKIMKELLNEAQPTFANPLLSAVVIEVVDDGDNGLDMEIVEKYTNSDFKDRLMNGTHPDDNFINVDYIPKKEGLYIFDVGYNGGKDFNGETTEYWFECWLQNCRPYNSR